MITKKQEIIVAGNNPSIVTLLEYRYKIKEILSLPVYLEKLVELWEDRDRDEIERIADFIIVGEEIGSEQFLSPSNTSSTMYDKLKNIYNIHNELYFNPPTLLGFGSGALAVAKIQHANLLYGISNHNNTSHLTSFIMSDKKILDFDVKSNHIHLIVPNKNQSFEVLAFSTYNNSQSYTDSKGNTFKAYRDFIEIEVLKFKNSNAFCFLYEVPKKGESVLIDLTLELLKR